jgi:hypothetical protein
VKRSQTLSIDSFSFLGCLGQCSRNVFSHLTWVESRDSSVSIVTRLWSGQPGVQFPAGARNAWLLQNVQTSFGAHPAVCSLDTDVLPRGKAARMCGWPLTYLSLASTLRIGVMPLLLLLCLHGKILCFSLPWVR